MKLQTTAASSQHAHLDSTLQPNDKAALGLQLLLPASCRTNRSNRMLVMHQPDLVASTEEGVAPERHACGAHKHAPASSWLSLDSTVQRNLLTGHI